MGATMVAQPYATTGQIGMWAGTKDGKPAFVDDVTKATNLNQPTEIQITVEDARYAEPRPTLKANGYEMAHFPTAVADEHFVNFKEAASDDVIRTVYAEECARLVKQVSGASVVIPYNWKTRLQNKKISDAVEARTEAAGGGLPVAHVDRDNSSALVCLRHVVGDAECERLTRTYRRRAIINVWRPVGAAVEKWPLCLVNTQGIRDWRYDTHMARIVYKNGFDTLANGPKPHEVVLKNDDALRFHYLSNQKPDEAWVFASFDSDESKVAPHGAFWDHSSSSDAAPRRSFELRCWCFFDEIET